jgi:hypothetical protein
MNERITKLFVCCLNNQVIAFETNLLEFHKKMTEIEPSVYGYRWLGKKFKESPTFEQSFSGKNYTFQQLV